jgi:hypothetical protein
MMLGGGIMVNVVVVGIGAWGKNLARTFFQLSGVCHYET